VIFVVAVLGELGGTYAIWRWLRTDSPPFLALVGAAALFGYAVVQTLQPEDRYGACSPHTRASSSLAPCSGAGASTAKSQTASTGSAQRSCCSA
jgi:Uncharacterised BCR, YnfA/UPF0060 family